MLGSQTLEVAIGVAVLFSFMSLFASAAREFIEVYAKQRAALVHEALTELFPPGKSEQKESADTLGERNAPSEAKESPTVGEFYNSIVISPLFRGVYQTGKSLKDLPSYITAGDFASAILTIARTQATADDKAKLAAGGAETPVSDDKALLPSNAWLNSISDVRLSQLVNLAFDFGGGDADKARAFLEQRFNSQMERVSGWYKRSTQVILFFIGLGSAAILNVDAIAVTQHLYRNDTLRQLIVERTEANPPSLSSASGTQPTQVSDRKKDAKAGKNGAAAKNETAGDANAAGQNSLSAGNQVTAPANDRATMNAAATGSGGDANAAVENTDVANGAGSETEAQAASKVNQVAAELRGYGFPMGWSWEGKWPTAVPQCALHARAGQPCELGVRGLLAMVIGWFITAFAISLGAPFWFDILNKIMVIRSTVKPFEKSPPEGSEDRQPQAPVALLKLDTGAAATTK